jgi:hypothetical protein
MALFGVLTLCRLVENKDVPLPFQVLKDEHDYIYVCTGYGAHQSQTEQTERRTSVRSNLVLVEALRPHPP